MKRRILLILLMLVVLAGATGTGLYFFQTASAAEPAGTDDTADAKPGDDDALEAKKEGQEGEDDADPAVPVQVAEVERGSVSTYISATANLIPEDQVQVLSEAEGRVTQLLVEEGDFVKKDQLLATLLRDEAMISLKKAELKAKNALLAFERAERVAGEQLISREDFDKIAMDHHIAEQEMAEAQWSVDKTEIRAPFTGRITLRNVTLGQHVRLSDELFTLTDFTPLIARIYLPERDVLGLEEGRKVKITLKADEDVQFAGKIRQISPVVDVATGTVKITVAAISPPRAVRPGGFVTIDITRETRNAALIVPREAVIREMNRAHVFIANAEVAVRRTVTVGLEEGDQLELVSGVEAGERVIVAGQGGLKDGATIQVLPDATAQAALENDGSPDRAQG